MKLWNNSEWRSEEASLCNNSVVFLLCGDFCVYVSIKTATESEKLACWTEGFSTADLNSNLDFDSFRVSLLGSFGILFSSRLNSLYSNHLENHLVHTGTSLYKCAHIMTSSNSTLVHFFRRFYFAEADLAAKGTKICTKWKFPAIWYIMTYWHCIPGAVNRQ